MDTIQNLTNYDYHYSWTDDSSTWYPWSPVGGITAAPPVTIYPIVIEPEFIFEPFKLGPVEPIKEKKKKFLRLIRPIKE